jgi:hypothetical protein
MCDLNQKRKVSSSESIQHGLFSRLVSTVVRNDSNQDDINNLKIESKVLEDLSRELFQEINDLRLEKARILFSQTVQGRFFNVLGYFFSVYCVYKIFIVSILFYLLN